MKTFYKFLMLINAIGVVHAFLVPDFDIWRVMTFVSTLVLSGYLLMYHEAQRKISFHKFSYAMDNTVLMHATADEIMEYQRLAHGPNPVAAVGYEYRLFMKYKEKVGK